jgi:hypothetical protein
MSNYIQRSKACGVKLIVQFSGNKVWPFIALTYTILMVWQTVWILRLIHIAISIKNNAPKKASHPGGVRKRGIAEAQNPCILLSGLFIYKDKFASFRAEKPKFGQPKLFAASPLILPSYFSRSQVWK